MEVPSLFLLALLLALPAGAVAPEVLLDRLSSCGLNVGSARRSNWVCARGSPKLRAHLSGSLGYRMQATL